MNKIKKILLSGLMLLTSIMPSTIPIHANENVSVKLSVIGDGEVKIVQDDFEETMSKDDFLTKEIPINSELSFIITDKSQVLKQVSINQEPVEIVRESNTVSTLKHAVKGNEEIIFEFGNDLNDNYPMAQSELNLEKIDVSRISNVPDDVQAILEDYQDGNKMKPEYIEARKKIAEELGALSYVDENYFLTDAYWDEFGTANLINCMGGWILRDPEYIYFKKFDPNFPSLLSMDAPKLTMARESGTIRINFKNGSYVYGPAGHWEVDGHPAFCGNAYYAMPKLGQVHKPAKPVTNANIKKMLYYGYKGPKDQLTSKFGADVAAFVTSELVSHYNGNGMIYGSVGGQASDYINEYATFMNDTSLTVPSSFKVYIAESNSTGTSWQGKETPCQPMVFWINEPKGELQIKKESAKTDVTDNNDCYSLEGAEYGVYKTKKDDKVSDKVGTLTIGKDGWSNKLSLDVGTFYIQEVKSPTGYELDTTIYTVTVSSGTLTTKTYKDNPLMDPVTIMVGKIDKETSLNKPQGSGSLENAQFTVKYYKGNYDEGVDPATKGVAPTKQWVLKTDKDGYARLGDEFKVSGDDFYYNAAKVPSLPDGTLTIKETLAPQGYKLNDELFIKKLTYGASNKVNVFHAPTVPEAVIKFHLKKVQADTNIAIPNATFIHTKPNGTTETLTTDANGFINIVGLETGTHTLKESSVGDGLLVNPNEFKFSVASGGAITVITSNLENKGLYYELLPSGNGQVTVEDEVAPFDFKVYKINDKNAPLDRAEFTLYSDAACTKVITKLTTKNGSVTFPKLKDRTNYYLKETKAPQGYRIPVDANGKVHVYKLYTESTPSKNIFDFYVDDVKYNVNNTSGTVHLEGTKANRIVTITITNYIGIQLPDTGSKLMIPLLIAGSLLMGSAIFMKRRKDKK